MANRPWITVFPPEPERNDIPPVAPQLHQMPQRDAEPVDYFLLIFTVNLMKEFVRQTNRYARHFINTHVLSRCARMRDWKPVTLPELRQFLSVIFNMGLVRKTSITEYWNSSLPSQGTSWFHRVMPRNRFQLILKCLHITDVNRIPKRHDPGYSPDSRFKPLLTFVNSRFKALYTPERELSIDESLVASKGKSIMRQYIPSKSAKFGIKFWMLVEACSGYVMNMTVYRGKTYNPTSRGEQQGTNVVMGLMRACELLHKGYHIFCDSFFSSISLARSLLIEGTFLTGTLRKNRPMPRTIKDANPNAGGSVFMRSGNILCMSHRSERAKKPVRLLSTVLPASIINGKHHVVTAYNRFMGGVDISDAMVDVYAGDRKSLKVWKKIILHIFHRVMLNAYILYSKNTSDQPVKTRLQFTQLVIESLAGNGMAEVRRRVRRCVRIEVIKEGKEKDCAVCSRRREEGGVGRRRRSRTQCTLCLIGVHRHCRRGHCCVEQ